MTARPWVHGTLSILLALVATGADAQETDDLPPEVAAEIEKVRPMVEEAQRIQDCLKPELARRELEIDAALARLDSSPDAAVLRANILRLYAQDLAFDTEGHAKAEAAPGVRAPLLAYALRGTSTFDFPVVARSLSVAAVYLDRALGGPCRPNDDILTFTGVTARAD